MKAKPFLFCSIILVCVGCRYRPFANYYFPKKKTDFPAFSKSTRFKGEVNELRAYNITTYDWYVKVVPEKKFIESTMKIAFTMESDQDSMLLDLQKRLKVEAISSTFQIKSWRHQNDLLYIYFSQPVPVGSQGSLEISYFGNPASILGEGPIQWKEDKNGKPWISTQTEGLGAHFMMPCKELLYDEPEQCLIHVSVPNDLVAVANGKLDSTSINSNFKTFHWSVHNPINIYNISFNIGDFVRIDKPYVDINGEKRQLQVFPLRQDEGKASEFYEQTALHVKALEELYGVFPWWNDGFKVVQSTLGGGAMEHQSAISMGSILTNDYRPPKDCLHVNTTLIHEISHEWWGNLITGYDYCDMWIHEGMATFSEMLVVEKLYEPRYYDVYARWLANYVGNRRPILKPCGVRYNSWVSQYDGDIYNKGALMMHSFRRQLSDDQLFFKLLKNALDEFAKQNISSDELVAFFNDQTSTDFQPLFDIYLRYAEPPKLVYQYDSIANKLDYRWEEPLREDYKYWVVASIGDERVKLTPTASKQSIGAEKRPIFDIADFGYVLLEEEKH